LAGHLGRTVDELLSSISSRELAHWRAFDLLEPIGFTGANLLMAALRKTMLEGSPKFRTDGLPSLEKFMLDLDPDPVDFMTEQEKADFEAKKLMSFFNSF